MHEIGVLYYIHYDIRASLLGLIKFNFGIQRLWDIPNKIGPVLGRFDLKSSLKVERKDKQDMIENLTNVLQYATCSSTSLCPLAVVY